MSVANMKSLQANNHGRCPISIANSSYTQRFISFRILLFLFLFASHFSYFGINLAKHVISIKLLHKIYKRFTLLILYDYKYTCMYKPMSKCAYIFK